MKRPHIIAAQGVYDLEAARTTLGLKQGTLPREIRMRRLRASKRGGRYYILGQWLLDWLAAGEVHRDRRPEHALARGAD